MKKIAFILLAALFSKLGIGQQTAVPAVVESAFHSRFADAHVLRWTAGNGLYAARFRDQGKTCFAYFNRDGRWTGTEKKLSRSRIPQLVRQAFNTGNYKTWYMDEVREISGSDSALYVMEVNNSSTLDADHAAAFREDYLLFYDAGGRLLKEERKRDEIK